MELIGEDLSVQSPKWGRIYVRNKRPAGVEKFAPDRIVIMQHGATYGSAAFDLPFGGISWMDYIAARGFDVYCIDLPGYGRSERPAQMAEPAENNPPFMRTPDAAECVGTVVDFVCDRRGVDRLCLVGWSWGTAITSTYTASHADRVERLALYAPVWDRTDSSPSAIHVDGPLGAYRTVNREATIKRRQNGLTPELAAKVMPTEWFDMWWDATAAADPDAAPGTIRAPNGVIQDSLEYWNVGKPLYDPSQVKAPVLIIVGEWDVDTKPDLAINLYPLFTNAAWKRLSIVSGGTHSLMMEANRMLLFRSVQQFLEEQPPSVETTS
jgi:pimeloyl-ACP methyl ester carboxylesterase